MDAYLGFGPNKKYKPKACRHYFINYSKILICITNGCTQRYKSHSNTT